MLKDIVTRSSAREKGSQEKSYVLKSAFQLKLEKKGVDYDAICTCQVGLSIMSICCLFSLSLLLLLSVALIIILYIVFLIVSAHLPSLYHFLCFFILFLSPFYFLIFYIRSFPSIYFYLSFIRLSCIHYGNLLVLADSRYCLKQKVVTRLRMSCEVQGYNALKNDYVAWCNIDTVGDRYQNQKQKKGKHHEGAQNICCNKK